MNWTCERLIELSFQYSNDSYDNGHIIAYRNLMFSIIKICKEQKVSVPFSYARKLADWIVDRS